MNADFPNIVRGTRWGQTHARQWQNLAQTAEQLSRLTVGKGLRKRQSGSNLIIERVPTRMRRMRIAITGGVVMCHLKEIGDDWIKCALWDGETEGDSIYAAKAWRLRRTPFDNLTYEGNAYEYLSDVRRKATLNEEVQYEVIEPMYTVDEIVYVLAGNTGVVVHNEEEDDVDVMYLEVSPARMWMREYGEW